MGRAKLHLKITYSDEHEADRGVYNNSFEIREINLAALEAKIREVVEKFKEDPEDQEDKEMGKKVE